MRPFEERGMTWREFEHHCVTLVNKCFPDDTYRVTDQSVKTYADGQTKRMDIRVAERRQGGRHYVIDCKHWPIANLNENEVDTTLDYQKRSKASKAIILVSASSNCPQRFLDYADRKGVPVIPVSTVDTFLVRHVREFFFRKEIRQHIP